MSDASAAKKPLDTAAATTVLERLAEKQAKFAKKAEKSEKTAKKVEKAMEEVLKTYGIDPNDTEKGGTPPHVVTILADMAAVREKFNNKAAKFVKKGEKIEKAITQVQKAFKIKTPAAPLPLPTGPRQIIYSVDLGGATSLRGRLADITTAIDTANSEVVASGRRAVPFLGYFSRDFWSLINVDQGAPAVDAEFRGVLRDALKTPFFAEAGLDSLVRELDNGGTSSGAPAAARHFVLISNNPVLRNEEALTDLLAKNPTATIDVVVTDGSAADVLAATRTAYPRRVAVHAAPTNAALVTTLATITNARLDQRLAALNVQPRKAPTP